MTLGSQIFFHQQLEARNTQTTVTLDCEWSVGKKRKEKEEQEEMDENSRVTDWSAWSLRGPGPLLSVDPRKKNYDKAREANSK